MTDKVSLSERIDLLAALGNYMLSENEAWQVAKEDAGHANAWFTSEHIERAIANIAHEYLQKDKLQQWIDTYPIPASTKTVGIVMAGNIPLVGFHDFLCGFLSGHNLSLKLSSKDEILPKHLLGWLLEAAPALAGQITIAERLNGCEAYIATGSNNTARYFEQYFGKYPHIIRSNRTSVAILDGTETDEELSLLADDVYLYYGLGCRNVTQICVPKEYDFARLLRIFNRYSYYADLNKYKNNYDYHLAIYLLNRVQCMSNESLLMVENSLPFSAVSVLHYRLYEDKELLLSALQNSNDIQAIIGKGLVPFGSSQKPALNDYADGADTMAFLCGL
jgi:hypothetical protein